jgi:hypothetical protein
LWDDFRQISVHWTALSPESPPVILADRGY